VSLVLAASLTAGCGAAKVGKTEFAEACAERIGSTEKCGCYADSVEQALSPEQFQTLASGVHSMRDMAGSEWIPARVRNDAAINSAINDATAACLTVASR
jgi:hypothetical protein